MEPPDPEAQQGSTHQLQPCPICGRTFRPDALSRHQGVCERNAARKRRVFDSSKQRAPEDAAPPALKQKQRANQHHKEKSSSNWREKHEDLIRTIKQARKQDESGTTDQEKKGVVPSGYVECRGCGRRFIERAAERHVPWCEGRAPTRNNNTADHAKLIARVRYRPPQGKSRNRKEKTAEPEESSRKSQLHSSAPAFLDNRNGNQLERINNNNVAARQKRSVSRERALVKSQPEPILPHHIIKFKDKFPNHTTKRNCCDLEDSLTSDQLRDLLSVSRTDRGGPKTVPGVRLSGGRNGDRNRSSDVSRSSSSGGGSSNSPSLPEVSSSERPSRVCWEEEFVPLTFYCDLCGTKFPLLGAKYCCECGARRKGIGRLGPATG